MGVMCVYVYCVSLITTTNEYEVFDYYINMSDVGQCEENNLKLSRTMFFDNNYNCWITIDSANLITTILTEHSVKKFGNKKV